MNKLKLFMESDVYGTEIFGTALTLEKAQEALKNLVAAAKKQHRRDGITRKVGVIVGKAE